MNTRIGGLTERIFLCSVLLWIGVVSAHISYSHATSQDTSNPVERLVAGSSFFRTICLFVESTRNETKQMAKTGIIDSLSNRIVQGDCIEVMRRIPDSSIDVTFADPPFNLKKKYNKYYDKQEVSEYLRWCRDWLFEMVRVTKPTGSILVHNIPKWLIFFGSVP